jgi:hypothetical protein
MRKFAALLIEAWRVGKPKTVGRYRTDGTSVFAWGSIIATRSLDGRRFIVECSRGDGANHLIGCLRSAFPRAVRVEKIDMYYSTIYEPTIHYPPRRPAHKVRIGTPPRRAAVKPSRVARPDVGGEAGGA